MNEWTKKTINYINTGNYLDVLSNDVYWITAEKQKSTNKRVYKKKLMQVWNTGDNKKLLLELFRYDKFPFDNPLIPMLKLDNSLIDRNPNVVDDICNTLRKMGVECVIDKLKRSKRISRTMNNSFHEYLQSSKFDNIARYSTASDFIKATDRVKMFTASDKTLKDFAKKYIGYSRDKGIDFFAIVDKTIYVAEAKYISTKGGGQYHQFDDAMAMLNLTFKAKDIFKDYKVKPIVIMDGYPYIVSNNDNKVGNCFKSLSDDQVVVSALLLPEFLLNIK